MEVFEFGIIAAVLYLLFQLEILLSIKANWLVCLFIPIIFSIYIGLYYTVDLGIVSWYHSIIVESLDGLDILCLVVYWVTMPICKILLFFKRIFLE